MKLKNHTLIILLLFIMLFVCIGSVSALESQIDNIGENNVISTSESPEILTASASDDAVGMSSDENVISSNNRDWYVNASAADGGDGSNISPYNNFRSVLDNTNLQDGDNVYFAGKENYKGNGKNVNLNINKQLNLLKYGSGEAVFDAKHNSRIFTVYASCINITGLTFINGNADQGGAIYFENAISNSNINATYINNTATVRGGANYFSWIVSNSNITGTYSHNTAKDYNGGANYFSWTVSNSNINGTYNNNTAKNGNGGANYFYWTVSNSNINGTYNHNTAQRGGANSFLSSVSNSNITGTYINNNASNSIIHFQSNPGVEITNAIFLNNKCEYEIYARTLGVVVKDSWFGNNASNYMNKPNNYNVQMDSWLFLNGTNNQNDIKFFLMRYDGTTTSEYDNTLLPKINLTLTTTDGTLDKSVVSPDETVKFNPTESGIKRVTAQIEDAAQTIEFTMGDFNILQAVINNATSSVINLTRNYTYNQWDTMTDGVLIDRNVTINGNGFTIDAKDKSRIFKVTAGSINITNVTLKNGKADNGGAIYFENAISNSNINATYTNNTAEDSGGANYFYRVSNSNITGTYSHNTAKNGNGGANFFWESVSNSNITGTYTNNTANNGNGGANCFWESVSNSNINGTYSHNTANRYGGANFFWESVSDSNIAGTYSHNTAAVYHGGANFFNGDVSNSNITGTYINNTAKNGNGGANFFFDVSDSNIAGTYINNTASNSIIHFENYYNQGLDAYITNAIFLNNNCTYEIYALTLGVVVKDSWFGNNASNYMNKPNNYNVQMDSWLFLNGTNNQNDIKFFLMSYDGTTTSEYDNTLLPKINLTLTTTDGTLDKSVVSPDETVKFNPTESGIKRVTAQIEDAAQTIEFTMGDFNILQAVINNATSSVINLTRNYTYNQWDAMTEGVLIDRNVTINGNGFTIDAKDKSRIFKVTAGSINITNVTLKNGKADYGGAIYFENAISNSNINATYTNNTAIYGGANFYWSVSNSNINGTYSHNTADMDGGANFFLESVSDSNITGTYSHNTAGYDDGGANYFNGNVSNSNITGTYNHNTAKNGNGGANFFWESVSNSNITGTYTNNTAKNGNGGANCFWESVSNSNINGTYINNTANRYGGANCFLKSVSDSNIAGTYINNTANRYGGANCFGESVSNSNINGTYINNTAAEYHGGANFFNGDVSNSNINGTYNNNTAKNGNGGANHFKRSVSNSNITGTYINNTASNAIIQFSYDEGLDAEITNAIFLNNNCTYEIYACSSGVVVKDSWFGNNASNYMNKPNNYNVQMDSWLFLNGTNNQNDIKFFLMSYDGTATSEYDNTLLPEINLTITTTDGTLDKSVVSPDETVKFNPTESGIKRVTAQIEDAAQTIEFSMGDFNILQAVINNATSSVINLTRNYTYNQWDTMTEGVLIDRNVTINGNGFTIDAKDKSRIFKVTAGSINITNVTFKNGKAYNGGAIYFENAISNSNINATYTNNTAIYGGANFFNSVSDSNINGTYSHNTADRDGGANFFNGDVSNSNIAGTYINNSADMDGGANYFQSSVSNSNITGTYNNNTANGQDVYDGGGANYFIGSVSNSNINGTYNNNTAERGGANYFYRVSNSNITGTYNNNTANQNGGANYFYRVSNSNINGTYNHNTANGQGFYGGGANSFGSVSNSNINGTYNHNTANNGDGGANNFFNPVSNSNINGIYNHNTANQRGGANSFIGSVSNSNINGTYNHNTANQRGGANYFDYVSNSNITGTYINNTASNAIIQFSYDEDLDAYITNAIFLNNNCTYEIYAPTPGVVVKDSWFGNNASNYMNKPNINNNITIDNWLFLNATADLTSILVFDSSDVLFKLYSTNGTYIYEYENSKLPVVNLTLTATNGEVSNSTTLDKSAEYRATKVGQGSVTASVENAEYTIFFDNNKRSVDLSVKIEPQEISYGENTSVILDYNSTATGKVNITLTGKKYNKTFENLDLNKTIQLPDNILPDEYEVTVSYSGGDVFLNSSATGALTVNKLKSDIKVKSHDIYVNDTKGVMFTVTLPENATGNLTISNGEMLNVSQIGIKDNGYLIVNITNSAYSVGQYNWTFTYSGDDIYENSEAKATANILIIPTEIIANTTSSLFVDDTAQITYNLTPCDAVGIIKFTSNDTSVVEVDQDGNIKAIGEGKAIITVTFEGSKNYTASSTNVTLTVSKIATEITLTNVTIELKAYQRIGDLAALFPSEAGNLKYVSNNEDIVLVSDDGIIYARKNGTATVTVSFAGDDKYKAAESKNITVTVTLNDASVSVENDTIDLYVDDTCIINATANPRFLAVYYASSNESVASVTEYGNVKAVGEGTAIITLTVGNGETYAVNSTNVTVTVSKISTEIIIENETLDLKVNDKVDSGVSLNPSEAGNLTYIISNSSIIKLLDNQIIALSEGTATITYSFNGTDRYAAADNKTITVAVSLNDASVSVNNATLELFVGDNFTIVADTLPAGLNVTFVQDDSGVYLVDENGLVTALKNGTGNILVKVGGDGVYAENSTEIAVTVSKVPTVINVDSASLDLFVGGDTVIVANLTPDDAGNVTFTSSDDSIVIVDDQGNVIADAKGTAIITVSFAGDNKYAAAESKNITVNVSLNDGSVTVENDTLDLEIGETYKINATKNPDTILLDISYSSSNSSVASVDENGTVTAVGEGTAVITVEVGDGEIYAKNSTNVTVNVKDKTINVSAPDVEKYYGGNESFVVTVTDSRGNPLANKSVEITLNGAEYNRTTDADGMASIALNLNSGVYNVTATVDNVGVNSTITVKSTVNGNDLVKVFRNATQFYADFKDSEGNYLAKGTMVSFNINGVFYNRTVEENGRAKLNINLEQGNYIITSMNTVTGENAANNVTVIARLVENSDLVKYYRNASQYTVKVIGDDGKPVGAGETVSFNVNGVLYNRTTDESGIATLNINLHPGDYIITAEYKDCRVSNNITVLPVLNATDLTKKYGTSDQFVVNLVNGTGAPYAEQIVSFNINGVFYKGVTDSAGQAKLNINLMPGEYIITSSYNGTNIANKVTVRS